MKKILAIIMSAMVAVTMLPTMAFATETDETKGASSASTSNCYIDLDDTNNGELTDEQAELMDQFVDELGKQLTYDETGINTLDVDVESLKAKYGEDVVDTTYEGIETINEGVEEDLYEVTDNGTIYETEDDDMYVQGKYNKNSGRTYYWGRIIYQSYKNSKKHEKSLRKCKRAEDLIGEICTICGFGGGATMYADGVAALAISKYSGNFANSIRKYNKANYGIKYKLWWSMKYTMRTQNKGW